MLATVAPQPEPSAERQTLARSPSRAILADPMKINRLFALLRSKLFASCEEIAGPRLSPAAAHPNRFGRWESLNARNCVATAADGHSRGPLRLRLRRHAVLFAAPFLLFAISSHAA